ncbi:YggT family protein [Limibaculum sp. M0105]|uniref:YggT family protein n=1 Tax=Thermohalobaculum xanthum TaxID=2753746 RepID=A0A8J7M584_9RHOB|nr:YggT family protein [Thermohalobaculum xanthum]MBK0398070.1 YggT family protein [Thermohalobaculum xanthum]
MASFLAIFNLAVDLVFWVIIIQAIMSWLIAFNVLNTRQQFVWQVWNALNRLTEPLYRPVRRFMPDMGGIDLAPLLVLFALFALQVLVNNNLAPLAYG